jgi:hypothetical protein
MTRARPSLLLPLLAIAACQTQRKPLTGFDTPPPGILLDNNTGSGSAVLFWPVFDLPPTPEQEFLPQLNGQDAVIMTSDEGFYDYEIWSFEGWTGGFSDWLFGVPPGTYTVGLVDGNGQSWGQSAPLPLLPPARPANPLAQLPAAIFTHFGGQAGTWTIDPTTQDADPTTDEITVTNLLQEDVDVERCLISGGSPTSCTSVGTVAAGADLPTVETLAAVSSTADHEALVIYLASDASQSYQRDLIQGSGMFGGSCQIERILVHGTRPVLFNGANAFAMSSCYGYQSGPGPM